MEGKMRCVNPNCTREIKKFHRARQACREFFLNACGSAYVCVNCVKFYEDTRDALLKAMVNRQDFDFRSLPIFSSKWAKNSASEIVVEDDDDDDEAACSIIEDNDEEETNDSRGSQQWSLSCAREVIANVLEQTVQPMLERFLEGELERQAILQQEVTLFETACAQLDEKLEELRSTMCELDAEFPRQIAIRLGEVDADDSSVPLTRMYPEGLESWESEENEALAKKYGVSNLLHRSPRVSSGKKSMLRPGGTKAEMDSDETNGSETTTTDGDAVTVLHEGAALAAAKEDLPPIGQLSYPDIIVGTEVLVSKESSDCPEASWYIGRVLNAGAVEDKNDASKTTNTEKKIVVRTVDVGVLVISSRTLLAYLDPANVRVPFGTRVVVSDPDTGHYTSGTVTEPPLLINRFRYLVFLDNEKFCYRAHRDICVITDPCRRGAWEFCPKRISSLVKRFLQEWPERALVRLNKGDRHLVFHQGGFREALVVEVDCSLAKFRFEQRSDAEEWIYRGSPRLKMIYDSLMHVSKRGRGSLPARFTMQNPRGFSGIVQYTNAVTDDKSSVPSAVNSISKTQMARKSTMGGRTQLVASQGTQNATGKPTTSLEASGYIKDVQVQSLLESRAYLNHTCGTRCFVVPAGVVHAVKNVRRERLSPFLYPLRLGFTRHVFMDVPSNAYMRNSTNTKNLLEYARVNAKKHDKLFVVCYTAPCGRKLPNIQAVHRYLKLTGIPLHIDEFLFLPRATVTSVFVCSPTEYLVSDITEAQENVPISCTNVFDGDEKPTVLLQRDYRSGRIFNPSRVPVNTDTSFLVSCDCEDDCSDAKFCACQMLTVQQATEPGQKPTKMNVLYKYRRLEERVDTGIYECNPGCKCKRDKCFNRVAQNKISVCLQMFKTECKSWGVRSLTSLPSGCFVATYSGEILTPEDGIVDGSKFGDAYLAELDFIQLNERDKEGYESEAVTSGEEEGGISSEGDEVESKEAKLKGTKKRVAKKRGKRNNSKQAVTGSDEDTDYLSSVQASEASRERSERSTAIERRQRRKKDDEEKKLRKEAEELVFKGGNTKDSEQPLPKPLENGYVPLLRIYRENNPYIMNAKMGGNIGKFFNHSCDPNMFVQNVFVDTHDPRFTWIAMFTSREIQPGEELSWDYGYQVGSIPGRKVICHCGAESCRGRLL